MLKKLLKKLLLYLPKLLRGAADTLNKDGDGRTDSLQDE